MGSKNKMNKELLKIVEKMGDINLNFLIPSHECEELKNKFEILQYDFLYNIRVIAEKDKCIQEFQKIHDDLQIQLQNKDLEMFEIKKEYEGLKRAQEDLYNSYKDLRKNFETPDSEKYMKKCDNCERNKIPCINVEFNNDSDAFASREIKLLGKISFLENQLKQTVEDNSNLHNQILNLQQNLNKSSSIYKNEIHELKYAQTLITQQLQDSLVAGQKINEENVRINSEINKIISVVLASTNTFKLKQLHSSFNLAASNVTIDPYNFIKMFIHEICQKINEYETYIEHNQNEFKDKSEENIFKQYKQKINHQEEELNHLKQQNSILINVIKEMKQNGQYIPVSEKKVPTKKYDDHKATENSSDIQSDESGLLKKIESRCSNFSHINCSAEKLLINLNKKMESLFQSRDTDQEGENQIQKLENHLRYLKDHLIQKLQEKMSAIDKSYNESITMIK